MHAKTQHIGEPIGSSSRPNQGAVLWLTGLSGAGKSTLANAVRDALAARGCAVEVLDGDEVRTHLSAGLSFSRQDRDTNVMRIAFVAKLLAKHGVIAITAAISPYRETRERARQMIGERFVEVYVSAPIQTCEERDVKGLYKRARSGELESFTGISDPYEPPLSPEVQVASHEVTVEHGVAQILEGLYKATS
jgi:adenylyl-sulfate kinase